MLENAETQFNFLVIIGVCDTVKLPIVLFSAIIVGFYYISMIFSVIASLSHFASTSYFTVCFSYLFLHALSMLIWPLLYVRRQKIILIIQKLCLYRKKYNIEKKSSKIIQKTTVILISMIFILSQLLQYFENETESTEYLKFWTLGYEIPKGGLRIVILILINLVFFTVSTFPVLMSFFVSIILYKWSEVLQFYNRSLQLHLCAVNKYEVMEHFADFFKITKVLRDIKEVTNYPLLCIILYSLNDLFLSLYVLITWKDLTSSNIACIMLWIGSALLMLFMYSVSSSMIPENLNVIRLTAQEKINEHVFGLIPSIPEHVLMCLRRIETQKIICINVFDVFRLTKSFILSAIGSALTYDLLIINTLMIRNDSDV